MDYTKSRLSGAVEDYKKMYNVIKNWDEQPPPTEYKDGKYYNEEGHYIYGIGYALQDMPFHGWIGAAAKNEWYHYEEIEKAYKNLKIALENALGIANQKKRSNDEIMSNKKEKYKYLVCDTLTGYSGRVTAKCSYYWKRPKQYLVETNDATGKPVAQWIEESRLQYKNIRTRTDDNWVEF